MRRMARAEEGSTIREEDGLVMGLLYGRYWCRLSDRPSEIADAIDRVS
jgi:hypothetical protein